MPVSKKKRVMRHSKPTPFMQGGKRRQMESSIRKFNRYIKSVKNVAYVTTG